MAGAMILVAFAVLHVALSFCVAEFAEARGLSRKKYFRLSLLVTPLYALPLAIIASSRRSSDDGEVQ